MTGMPDDHRLLVEPRHAVVADVEPAVDARGRPCEHEQQRGDVQREVASAVQPDAGERERGDRTERAGESGEGAELDGPLGRGEREQQQADGGGAEQPPHRSGRHAGQAAAAKQDREHAEHAQQQHQHREAPGQRAVDAVLDGQEVVPQEVLVPGDGRADDVLDAGRLGDGRQRLVAEDDHEHQRRRGGEGGEWGERAVDVPLGADVPGDGSGADQQRGQRDQPLRGQRDGERRDHDRGRRRPQPAGADRVLHQHPGQQDAERDDRLGSQIRC